MMAATHALAGATLSLPLVRVAPELAPVAALAGLAGGLFPDLDQYVGHRRLLHYPVYYPLAAVPAAGVALAAPGPLTVAVATFLAAAAVHAAMDVLGGGLELRPWEATSERAVYSHYHGGWLRPRRWVRYDGAPEDLLLAVGFGIGPFLAYGFPIDWLVGGLVAVAAVYSLLRRRLAGVVDWLVDRLPAGVRRRLPPRYTDGK